MRKEYFSAILRQEVGWFDSINPNELNTKVADETFAVEDAKNFQQLVDGNQVW
ncbi:unnamed protein product [Paramecium primaurelia]|nr:unnamed protein product [Paramecium primaurelia]